jgi:hypothetical protein
MPISIATQAEAQVNAQKLRRGQLAGAPAMVASGNVLQQNQVQAPVYRERMALTASQANTALTGKGMSRSQ